MPRTRKLAPYRARRDFGLTPEPGGGERERWLLVKMDDEEADRRRNPVRSQPESVKSGRTLEQVAARARASASLTAARSSRGRRSR